MNISKLCQQLFNNKNLEVGTKDSIVKFSYFKKEYNNIKLYLLNNATNNSKIGIYLEKNHFYILTMLAVMEVGLTFVPLNKRWNKSKNEEIISNAKCDIVITQEDIQDIISSTFPPIDKDFLHLDNPLYIIFTSGSTGTPKGVVINRKGYLNFLNWVDSYFNNINKTDSLLNTADFTFDLSLIDIALLLTKQLNFYISNFDGNIFKLLLEVQTMKISTIATVPNNINLLLSDNIFKKADISSLKFLLLGGARFSNGLYIKLFEKLKNIKVYNLYGPTEATVYCSAIELKNVPNEIVNTSITIGKPISNMNLIIHNDEVLISGTQLMNGYLDNQEQTDKVFVSINDTKYYKTGDLGFKDKNDSFFIIGRVDDTIKCSGYRVNLSDIDSLISKTSYVEECATIAIKNEIKENILISYIKLNSSISKNKLVEYLESKLLPHQIPENIYFLDNFPLNNSGKISKKCLLQQYKENHGN